MCHGSTLSSAKLSRPGVLCSRNGKEKHETASGFRGDLRQNGGGTFFSYFSFFSFFWFVAAAADFLLFRLDSKGCFSMYEAAVSFVGDWRLRGVRIKHARKTRERLKLCKGEGIDARLHRFAGSGIIEDGTNSIYIVDQRARIRYNLSLAEQLWENEERMRDDEPAGRLLSSVSTASSITGLLCTAVGDRGDPEDNVLARWFEALVSLFDARVLACI